MVVVDRQRRSGWKTHFRDRLLPPVFIEDVQATLAWASRRPPHIMHDLREDIRVEVEVGADGRGPEAASARLPQCCCCGEKSTPETSDASAPRRGAETSDERCHQRREHVPL